jgi:hypothetical protein
MKVMKNMKTRAVAGIARRTLPAMPAWLLAADTRSLHALHDLHGERL